MIYRAKIINLDSSVLAFGATTERPRMAPGGVHGVASAREESHTNARNFSHQSTPPPTHKFLFSPKAKTKKAEKKVEVEALRCARSSGVFRRRLALGATPPWWIRIHPSLFCRESAASRGMRRRKRPSSAKKRHLIVISTHRISFSLPVSLSLSFSFSFSISLSFSLSHTFSCSAVLSNAQHACVRCIYRDVAGPEPGPDRWWQRY